MELKDHNLDEKSAWFFHTEIVLRDYWFSGHDWGFSVRKSVMVDFFPWQKTCPTINSLLLEMYRPMGMMVLAVFWDAFSRCGRWQLSPAAWLLLHMILECSLENTPVQTALMILLQKNYVEKVPWGQEVLNHQTNPWQSCKKIKKE